jgi:class 3 adenylate cyclase
MSSLPQGTITFLFSDIEGSTQLAKRFGDAQWADLLEAHRTVLRRAFVGHAGSEVDAQGDAFFVVFSRATDAVAAALAAQQALLAHDWPAGGAVRVRMGLHTGEATFRDGCYIGQEVHRASRICGVGHGGQILLSQATSEIVRSYLPQSITLNELGEHRLKGLRELHRLFQLLAPGLTTTFPPLRSLRAPNNLPVERSSFVGREQEIIAVLGALAEHRLVTLTGIGGSGKTRLALQVGALEIGNFPDGVFFVDLAPVSDPDLVPQTLAAACGMAPGDSPSGTARTFVERVAVAMAPRRSLLLVDNCEHVLDAAAILIDRLLTVCEQIVVLATSRESLGVEGEQIVQLPSLTVPGESANAEVTEAMRLFAERAHACSASFKLGADTMGPVAEICRRLDGIPLAIEFAAARVSHLSVQQIAERLENRFSLLTGGRRRVHRQQTLAASLDWSHDLLDEEERMVFRRAGVFAGGF